MNRAKVLLVNCFGKHGVALSMVESGQDRGGMTEQALFVGGRTVEQHCAQLLLKGLQLLLPQTVAI